MLGLKVPQLIEFSDFSLLGSPKVPLDHTQISNERVYEIMAVKCLLAGVSLDVLDQNAGGLEELAVDLEVLAVEED